MFRRFAKGFVKRDFVALGSGVETFGRLGGCPSEVHSINSSPREECENLRASWLLLIPTFDPRCTVPFAELNLR